MELNELIEGCKKQEYKYQKLLYDLYKNRLYGICMRYARRKEDADDMFQEGFIKIFNNLVKYENLGSFEGWLKRIMVNACLNYYRYDKSWLSVDITELEIGSSERNFDEFIDTYTAEQITKAIVKLPQQQQTVFNLIEIEDYDYEEVADMLGVTNACVRTHNFCAKKNLREMLKDLKIE